jgi:transposase
MGTLGATPAASEAPEGSSQCRSSAYHKRHPLDRSNRITLARPPREVWSLEDGCQSLLPLAEGWGLGSHTKSSPESQRRRRRVGLGGALSGHDHSQGSSARSRGKRGDQKEQALGYSQGGFSTKVHIRSEGRGKPMVFYLSEGQRNEIVGFWPLMESGEVKRAGGGRPRLRPRRICADKGYAKGVLRRYLRRLGIRITIARRSNEHRGGAFDREIYRTRNLIERLINRLKHFSGLRPATRSSRRTTGQC